MNRIGTRELRRDLAAHVRRAAAGEQVTVTIGGRPAAVLGPIGRVDAAVTLDSLLAAGLLRPRRRDDDAPPAPPTPVWSGVRLDLALREVRG
jgi:prevent-host-death family protein